MPRNPNKRRCQTKGCKAYAMRSLPGGAPANHCRSHLDHVLGRRNVGAPKGNLNAVKTGRYAHPVRNEILTSIALEITNDPDQMPAILSRELHKLYDRTGDVFASMYLMTRLIRQLLPLVADHMFHIELYNFLQNVPTISRPSMEAAIWSEALPLNPLKRLSALREANEHLQFIINNPDNNP